MKRPELPIFVRDLAELIVASHSTHRFVERGTQCDPLRERGDLLLILTHESRDETLALMSGLESSGWGPGDPLPDQPLGDY